MSSPFQAKVTFLRCGWLGRLLERLAADEVVVELHERAVAELVRRDVVVLDVVGDEAAADGAGGLVAVRRQPLAILLHLLAGVDRRQRRGNPARFERVGGIGARTDRHDAELFAGLEDRSRGFRRASAYGPQISRPGAPAMPWRRPRTLRPLMLIVSMLKNFTSGIGPPFSFSRICRAFGPWIW